MKTLLLICTILSSLNTQPTETFWGTAETPNYISCHCGCDQHYYLDEDFGIHKGDAVLIADGEVFVIDCTH